MPASRKVALTPTPAPAPAKEAKPKKPKLVRDSFTCPKDEYAVIDALKVRAAQQGHVVKKSELLRAGLKLLAGLEGEQLLAALQAIPSIKTGRPAKAEETPASPSASAPTERPAKVKKTAKAA
jgi:hypothetical protein